MRIAFDADDTLWHNEPLFNLTQAKVADMLGDWVSEEKLGTLINTIERRNLKLFGYGAKGFTLSLIETALEVSENRIPTSVVGEILDAGKAMMEHPVELLPGVEETLKAMSAEHPLMIVTKGDLFDQESKIARSGLADYFSAVEIVSEKDPETYRDLLRRHDIDAERFIMVGNSVKSDILPVVAVGGNAVHIPYESQWELDRVEHGGAEAEGFLEVPDITHVPDAVQRIASLGWADEG